MKPNRIILVRHGLSEANVHKTVHSTTPDHAVKLVEKGKRQARQAGETLSVLLGDERIYSYVSPYTRAQQTLDEIKTAGLNIVETRMDPRLREQEWGHLRSKEELEVIDADRDKFGTFFFRIPDGESGADVYDRVSTFLETMHRDFEKEDYPENVLIVSHGLTIRLFLMRWFHWSVEYFQSLRNIKNAEMVIMELKSQPLRVIPPEHLRYPNAHLSGPLAINKPKYEIITPLKTRPPV